MNTYHYTHEGKDYTVNAKCFEKALESIKARHGRHCHIWQVNDGVAPFTFDATTKQGYPCKIPHDGRNGNRKRHIYDLHVQSPFSYKKP